MDFVLELLGRYVLTGVILWGVILIMLVVRLVYKSFTYDGGFIISEFSESVDKHKKASKMTMLIRYVVWPYGIVKVIHMYMKEENRILNRLFKS